MAVKVTPLHKVAVRLNFEPRPGPCTLRIEPRYILENRLGGTQSRSGPDLSEERQICCPCQVSNPGWFLPLPAHYTE
jgi:hypothetical protein